MTGPVLTAHQWVNMTDVSVQLNATHTVSMTEDTDLATQAKHSSLLLTDELVSLLSLFLFGDLSFR